MPAPVPTIEQIAESDYVGLPIAKELQKGMIIILRIWKGDAYLSPADEIYDYLMSVRPLGGYCFTRHETSERPRLRHAIRVLQRMHASRPE